MREGDWIGKTEVLVCAANNLEGNCGHVEQLKLQYRPPNAALLAFFP